MLRGQLYNPLADTEDWTGAVVINPLNKEAAIIKPENSSSMHSETVLLLCLIFPSSFSRLLFESLALFYE